MFSVGSYLKWRPNWMSNYVIYSNSYNAKELRTSLAIRAVFFLLNVTDLKKIMFVGHKFI